MLQQHSLGMKATKRFAIQLFLWLIIWVVLWSQQNWDLDFIQTNYPVLIAQIVLLLALLFFNAPRFLFKKKNIQFVVSSIVIIALVSGLIGLILHKPTPEPIIRNGLISPIHPGPGEMLLQQKTPDPKSVLAINVLLLVITYILGTVIEFLVYSQKREQEIIVSKNEKLQTELKFLKSQINPHFLFNALNNIYALSAIDTGKTQQSITYLSNMLRYVLYECDRPVVAIEKEIDYINNYIQLFTLKSSKSYPIATEIDLIDQSIEIAPMLLIPFVENALKHSNIGKNEDSFISIVLKSDENNIYFSIENSFGSEPTTKDNVGGIGLENVQKRLAILYPEKHLLTITSKDRIFSVHLELNRHV